MCARARVCVSQQCVSHHSPHLNTLNTPQYHSPHLNTHSVDMTGQLGQQHAVGGWLLLHLCRPLTKKELYRLLNQVLGVCLSWWVLLRCKLMMGSCKLHQLARAQPSQHLQLQQLAGRLKLRDLCGRLARRVNSSTWWYHHWRCSRSSLTLGLRLRLGCLWRLGWLGWLCWAVACLCWLCWLGQGCLEKRWENKLALEDASSTHAAVEPQTHARDSRR